METLLFFGEKNPMIKSYFGKINQKVSIKHNTAKIKRYYKHKSQDLSKIIQGICGRNSSNGNGRIDPVTK